MPSKNPFEISKTMVKKLPESERKGASDELWKKSTGLCALCNQPLGSSAEQIAADHRDAESHGGKTILSNLYLAHKSCNSSRKNIEFSVAQPLVQFKVYCENTSEVDFDSVLDTYVAKKNRQEISYQISKGEIQLELSSKNIRAPLQTDPATGTQYFFFECPVEYLLNDIEVQPRLISYPHVRKLAIDFIERPVHEPSNCRLTSTGEKTGELLQFDGQHKTTAQILIGRKTVPVKVYVEPDIAMLQLLVIKIQQEIKKQPLTKSDTLAKLGDVIKSALDEYSVKAGEARTEQGLYESQDKDHKAQIKKMYFLELERLVFFAEDNELTAWVKPGAVSPPNTDKVIIEKIIRPLIHQKLLKTVDMDKQGGRDTEREIILLICNTIVSKMLPKNWNSESNKLQKTRTENFFRQGAISWWMTVILIPTIRYLTIRLEEDTPLFIEPLAKEQRENLVEAVETLCDWTIWSTTDTEVIKAMRSNTLQNVKDVIPKLSSHDLIKEVTSAKK
ncbi:MAG: HNH endonuclease signature motif containing protein [Halioglobus sp.]